MQSISEKNTQMLSNFMNTMQTYWTNYEKLLRGPKLLQDLPDLSYVLYYINYSLLEHSHFLNNIEIFLILTFRACFI